VDVREPGLSGAGSKPHDFLSKIAKSRTPSVSYTICFKRFESLPHRRSAEREGGLVRRDLASIAERALLGSVRTPKRDVALIPIPFDVHLPRIAADLTILNKRPADVALEVDGHLFAAVRADDLEVGLHVRLPHGPQDVTAAAAPRTAYCSRPRMKRTAERRISSATSGGSVGRSETRNILWSRVATAEIPYPNRVVA
jgi:hypothetical protein